jgi:hypothetical protein
MQMMSNAPVPDLSAERPEGKPEFAARVSEYDGRGCLLSIAALVMLKIAYVELLQIWAKTALFAIVLGVAYVVSRMIFSSAFDAPSRSKPEPLVLEAFQRGLWLPREKTFIPYERLEEIWLRIDRERYSRSLSFVVAGANGEKKEILVPDGTLNITRQQIANKISILASKHNSAQSLEPPHLKSNVPSIVQKMEIGGEK